MKINKIIKIIVYIITVLIALFVLAYIFNLPIIDPLLSNQMVGKRVTQRAEKFFPNSIGGYSFLKEQSQKVVLRSMCNKMENNTTLNDAGRTGDACMETYSVTYGQTVSTTTATTTSNLVRVELSKFTKSADAFGLLIKETTKPDTLNGQIIFRTAPFRLGWVPISSQFNMVIVDEGQMITSSTTKTITYGGDASGNNEVTQYFLSKYPPKK